MLSVGEHLLAAMMCATLAAVDKRNQVRWLALSIAFVIFGFIKYAQIHGVL